MDMLSVKMLDREKSYKKSLLRNRNSDYRGFHIVILWVLCIFGTLLTLSRTGVTIDQSLFNC